MNAFCIIISEYELFESIVGVVVKRNRNVPESELICHKVREFWLLPSNQLLECSNGSGSGDYDGKDAVGSRSSTVNETVEFDVGYGKFLFQLAGHLLEP